MHRSTGPARPRTPRRRSSSARRLSSRSSGHPARARCSTATASSRRLIEDRERGTRRVGYIYWFADPALPGRAATTGWTSTCKLFEGEKFYLGPAGSARATRTTRDKVIRRGVRARRRRRHEHGGRQEERPEAPAARLLQGQRGAGVRASARSEKKVDLTLKGTGDLAQRDPVRRRLFGARRLLRPVLVPDAQLPRPRRGHRRRRPRSARSRTTTTSPTRFPGSWTATRRSGHPCSSHDGQLPEHRREAQGGHDVLRKGIGPVRQLVAAVPVREREGELPGARRAGASGPARAARQSSREVLGTTSSFTPGYRYDSRNDPFDPNQGYPILPRRCSWRRPRWRHRQLHQAFSIGGSGYINLRFPRRTYLAFNLEGGYVRQYGGNSIPISRALPDRRRAEPARLPGGGVGATAG